VGHIVVGDFLSGADYQSDNEYFADASYHTAKPLIDGVEESPESGDEFVWNHA
jgi:hypothetical protein